MPRRAWVIRPRPNRVLTDPFIGQCLVFVVERKAERLLFQARRVLRAWPGREQTSFHCKARVLGGSAIVVNRADFGVTLGAREQRFRELAMLTEEGRGDFVEVDDLHTFCSASPRRPSRRSASTVAAVGPLHLPLVCPRLHDTP